MRRIAVAIPTLLSVLRLVLTVPAAIAILHRDWGTALAVSMIAGSTDAADGWIARRFGLITRAGAWADPIADKTLLVTIYVCLAVTGVVPAWLVWLVLGRDVLILAMAGYAIAFTPFRNFPPSVWGKSQHRAPGDRRGRRDGCESCSGAARAGASSPAFRHRRRDPRQRRTLFLERCPEVARVVREVVIDRSGARG